MDYIHIKNCHTSKTICNAKLKGNREFCGRAQYGLYLSKFYTTFTAIILK